ncbi:MAG: hypothetical protein ABGX20_05580 [Bacillus sp. (in: firmicutes)]
MNLYQIRMKYQRANVTDKEGLNRDAKSFVKSKKVTPYEFSILGSIYEHVSENIEREAIKHRSAEEWRELERQHVVKASFTLPDLVDNLLRRLEKGSITREQLEAERRKYRPCKHRFCLNYFIPQRKDAVFCCRDCKEREKKAIAYFKKTAQIFDNGTYLPPTAYKVSHREELEKDYRKHERLFEDEALMLIADDLDDRVDRKNNERNLRSWRIEEEVKGGQNHVKFEETGNNPVKKIV